MINTSNFILFIFGKFQHGSSIGSSFYIPKANPIDSPKCLGACSY